MRSVLIFGAGGHARVIASILDRDVTFIDRPDEEAYFLDIGRLRNADVYIGIGDNAVRRRIFGRLRSAGISPATCIARHAFVARTASIGAGTVVCPGSVIMTDAVIGENVIVNTHSSVDHDCLLGHHTQLTVGVTLPGSVRVGENSFFGVGSATFPGITIGNNVVVSGGSLVINDLPDNVVARGNPARIIRSQDEP